MPGSCWTHFWGFLGGGVFRVTTPNVCIITGMTLNFCFSCSSSPCYLLIFSCAFFLISPSTGIAISISTSLSTTTVSRWLASSCLSVRKSKSQRTFALLFSTTFGGISHGDLGTSSPYVAQMFLYTIPSCI